MKGSRARVKDQRTKARELEIMKAESIMRISHAISTALVAITLAASGCGQSGAADREDFAIAEDTTLLVQTFRADAQARLDQLNAEINDLKLRTDSAASDVRAELQQQVQHLETRVVALQRQIDELAWRGETQWREATERLDEELDALRRELARTIAPEQAD